MMCHSWHWYVVYMCNGLEKVIDNADRQNGYSQLGDPRKTENRDARRHYS